MTTATDFWNDFEIIDAYTAADAVADGVLVDASEICEGAEQVAEYLKWPTIPVYLTSTLFGLLEQDSRDLLDAWIHVAVQGHNFAPMPRVFGQAGVEGQGWGEFTVYLGDELRRLRVSANVEGITFMLEGED